MVFLQRCAASARAAGFLVLLGFFFWPSSPIAWGARVQGSFRTHLYLREDRLVDPYEDYFLPVRQYLDLRVTELGNSGWAFYGSGWVRQDLAEDSGYIALDSDESFRSELLTGFLEWRNPRDPNTTVGIGRQFVFWGGIGERFDGLTLSRQFGNHMGAAVFGGIPAFSSYGGRSQDRVGGGRIWFRPFERSELGFSYVQRREEGDLDREVFTQDFFWRPFYWVELEQHFSYDTITDRIVETGLFGGFKFHPKAKFTVGYEESIPGALLPQTSILSVFSNDQIRELSFGLEFDPVPDWVLWGETVYFDSRSPGGSNRRFRVPGRGYWEYRLGTSYHYGNDARLSLEWRHLGVPEQGIPFVEDDDRYESIDNGFDRIRITNHQWINSWFWYTIEAGATYYRDRVNGSPYSFDFSGTWGYRPRRQLEAVATLRYVDSAVDNTEIQALLSITYYFDRRIEKRSEEDVFMGRSEGAGRRLPHTDYLAPVTFRE